MACTAIGRVHCKFACSLWAKLSSIIVYADLANSYVHMYRYAVTTFWGSFSWMMSGSAYCGMPPKPQTALMIADCTMMTFVR